MKLAPGVAGAGRIPDPDRHNLKEVSQLKLGGYLLSILCFWQPEGIRNSLGFVDGGELPLTE